MGRVTIPETDCGSSHVCPSVVALYILLIDTAGRNRKTPHEDSTLASKAILFESGSPA